MLAKPSVRVCLNPVELLKVGKESPRGRFLHLLEIPDPFEVKRTALGLLLSVLGERSKNEKAITHLDRENEHMFSAITNPLIVIKT